MILNRRSALRSGAVAAGLMLAGRLGAAATPRDITAISDFDELWSTLAQRYCFFGEKRTDWDKVRALYRPLAEAATTLDQFTDVVRRVLAELYDAHTHLSDPPVGAPRWPLFDLLAEKDGDAARIAAVADASAAADAGLRVGDRVLAVDGRPIAALAGDLMPRCLTAPDPEAEAYALNAAVAGRCGQARRLLVRRGTAAARTVDLPIKQGADLPDVTWRRLDGGVGLIAIRSFAQSAAVQAFDQALAALRDAPGLIIDVRGNGGGDTAVARPIMGRFVTEPRAYAMMRRREGDGLSDFWTEMVEPRGPFPYARPVVILINAWSASMAEGFPMGMRTICGATLVGAPMMRLGAAVFPIRLDRTGVAAQYSAEPVYDVNRRPRWRLTPDVEAAPGADILALGVRTLRAKLQ